MRRTSFRIALVIIAAATAICSQSSAKTISFVGVTYDRTDFSSSGLNIGQAGYWFPQFAAASPVMGRPTNENDRDALPAWAGPLNHVMSPADPTFGTRSFSLDNGGVRSKGGQVGWNTFTLPSGETGLSGAIVDPRTANNSNNTINRIQLNSGVPGDELPSSFLLHIITDNTAGEHNPLNRIRARGEGPTQVDVSYQLNAAALTFNETADVYTFRYDGWESGDFIKLQLNGGPNGASIAGVMFDAVPEPATLGNALIIGLAAVGQTLRRNAAIVRSPSTSR